MSTEGVARSNKTGKKRRRKKKRAQSLKVPVQRPGGSGGSGSGPHIPSGGSSGAGQSVPWWRRTWALVTGVVLALGALASAINAILGLVVPEPDLVDRAEITSLDIIPSVRLSEYERRAQAGAARVGEAQDLMLVRFLLPSSTAQAVVSPTEEPTEEPTDPSPSPTDSPTGSPTESPTEPPTESPSSATPSESPSERPTELPEGFRVDRLRYEEVLVDVGAAAPELELPDPQGPPPQPMIALIATMKDEEGNPVPPQEAARRLVRVLGHTRTVQTKEGKHDPLGVLVTANVALEGLKGRELGVFWEVWSQDGASRLYDRWLEEVPVSRIAAEREQDSGAFQFWVPMPKKPGEYVIHVIIKEGERLLVIDRSDPFK